MQKRGYKRGYKQTQEHKKNIRRAQLLKWEDPVYYQRMSNAHKHKYFHSPEFLQRQKNKQEAYQLILFLISFKKDLKINFLKNLPTPEIKIYKYFEEKEKKDVEILPHLQPLPILAKVKTKNKPSIKKLFKAVIKDLKKKLNEEARKIEKEEIQKFSCSLCRKPSIAFLNKKSLCRECYFLEKTRFSSRKFLVCPNCKFALRFKPHFRLVNILCPKCDFLVSKMQKELPSVYQTL